MPKDPKETKEPADGAKSKKPTAKTSKTARVLGLLTSPPPTEEPVASRAPAKPAPSDDRTVEAQVRSALEEELGQALADLPDPAGPAPAEDTAPAPQDTPGPEPEMPEPVLSFFQNVPPDPPPKPEEPEEEAESEVICFNLMQSLVEAKADKYIRLFGLCECPRCRTDVIALALTNLPAKYVVTSPEDVIPRLTYYEGKYNAAIVSQVMNACKRVMECPHHKR